MNNDDTITTTHIDQLRAGLLDRDLALKSRTRSALSRDHHLSAQNELWTGACEQLEISGNDDLRLTNQLRIRRRSVLSGRAAGKPRRFTLPQMAVTTVASMALTLSIVLLFGEQPRPGASSITQVDSAAPPDSINPGINPVLPSGTALDVDIDLTNNVDFYVWMEGQMASPDDPYIEMPRQGF
jgi:hypothetical protein